MGLFSLAYSRLVHYHNALRRMLGSSEVRGKASLDAGKNEKVNTKFRVADGCNHHRAYGTP